MTEFTSLLPSNATRFERDLERVTSRADTIPMLVATLWNPDTCPADHLGWLAWALSVDVWEDSWSEATKRAVIRQSGAVHRLKGTIGAVRRALAAIGVDIDITEWFEAEGVAREMAPHTFLLDAFAEDIFAGGFGVDIAFLEIVRKAIDTIKPVRSHYSVRIVDRFATGHYGRTGTRSRVRSLLTIEPGTRVHVCAANTAMRTGTRQRTTSHIDHDILRHNDHVGVT